MCHHKDLIVGQDYWYERREVPCFECGLEFEDFGMFTYLGHGTRFGIYGAIFQRANKDGITCKKCGYVHRYVLSPCASPEGEVLAESFFSGVSLELALTSWPLDAEKGVTQ
jgi:hypothetical protein